MTHYNNARQMARVAIVGGGELGGLLAHALARRDVAPDVRLVDDNGRAAAGKALDIGQAAPIEGFASNVTGSADLSVVASASVVVIADPFDARERTAEAAMLLLKRIHDFAPAAVIVCAGASDCGLIDGSVRELRVPRTQVLGSAPEALAGGVRALTAIELNGAPTDVSLSVLGIPPDHIVIPWEDATVAGFSLGRALSEPARRRLDSRVAGLWPPGPFALASAGAKIISAVLRGSRQLVTCFVAPDDSSGVRARAGALPVRLGRTGVTEVTMPALSVRERVRLENAMML
jgi:malate dehydrogenase